MKIAICDDEKVAAEYIGEVLETYLKINQWNIALNYIIQVKP